MANVIGVRFRRAGKMYYFAPGSLSIAPGDHVIVETARGIEYGYVVQGSHEVEEGKVIQPLKQVIRLATEEDRAHEAENAEKQKEAMDRAGVNYVCLTVGEIIASMVNKLLADQRQDQR